MNLEFVMIWIKNVALILIDGLGLRYQIEFTRLSSACQHILFLGIFLTNAIYFDTEYWD